MTAAEAEIARLRRELEYAIEAARENGKERDELAFKLGEETARSQEWMRKCERAQARADKAEAELKRLRAQ